MKLLAKNKDSNIIYDVEKTLIHMILKKKKRSPDKIFADSEISKLGNNLIKQRLKNH